MEHDNPARPPISGDNPFDLFALWFAEAEKNEINDPNAMALATLGDEGFPSLRIVLLKGYDANGFCFFTNTLSRKGKQLLGSPKAALTFHWKSIRRQVRIEGSVERVSEKEADDYFNSRPRGSQIGAWASLQSSHLDARSVLENRVKEFEEKYKGVPVPRPPHWSGYRVVPRFIEFWQDMPFRLHDRVVFTKNSNGNWAQERQYP
ncbi:MAG: pyridoxamine 5'-phosphate oxidase [Alphaproteobacteria bacterium]|nr:pyridoxamine 5'-phosphate oxidase [Alphaproteobacteria bacterium]